MSQRCSISDPRSNSQNPLALRPNMTYSPGSFCSIHCCPTGHPLQPGLPTGQTFCNACNEQVYDITYACRTCNFDACQSCMAYDSRTLSCPGKHVLSSTTSTHIHGCDMCACNILRGDAFFRCHQCNFDLCRSCASQKSYPNKQPQPIFVPQATVLPQSQVHNATFAPQTHIPQATFVSNINSVKPPSLSLGKLFGRLNKLNRPNGDDGQSRIQQFTEVGQNILDAYEAAGTALELGEVTLEVGGAAVEVTGSVASVLLSGLGA